MARMRIGDLLLAAKVIDDLQLKSALSLQKQYGGRLGDILVENGFLDEDLLWKALEKQLGIELVSLPKMDFPDDVTEWLPFALAERHDVFPVSREKNTVTIATSDPGNIDIVDDIQARSGLRVRTVIAPPREITWAIGYYYQGVKQPCPPRRKKGQPQTPSNEQEFVTETLSGQSQAEAGLRTQQAAPAPTRTPPPARAVSHPAPPAMADPVLQKIEADLMETTHLLRLIVDVCVQRGIFTHEEYNARVRAMPRQL